MPSGATHAAARGRLRATLQALGLRRQLECTGGSEPSRVSSLKSKIKVAGFLQRAAGFVENYNCGSEIIWERYFDAKCNRTIRSHKIPLEKGRRVRFARSFIHWNARVRVPSTIVSGARLQTYS